MTTPAELDPVVLALELDSAWEIAEGYRQEGERAKRIEQKYRAIHRVNQPKLDAFALIASLVWDWRNLTTRRPPEHVLQLIEARIKQANKMSREIAEEQK